MKKAIFLAVCLAFVSSSAFAATTLTMSLVKANTGLTLYGDADTATADTALIGKTSTGVGLSMAVNAVGYALITQHMQGTKAFASNYDSTSIKSMEVDTVGTVQEDVTDYTEDFAPGDGWTAL